MAKNLFPGMNPYLERHWAGVHAMLIVYAGDQLNRQLTGSLRARVEERLVVENPIRREERSIDLDVKVYEAPGGRESGGTALLEMTGVAAEPDVIQLAESDPETTTYLTIIDPSTGGEHVTVIEFLSPSNKEPEKTRAATLYRGNRAELRMADVNLVEVDLLRDVERFFPEYDNRYGKCLRAAYAACVWRAARPRNYEVYSFALRDRLPAIRIPLRKADPDVLLDLQPLVDQVYENGRYDDIDYARPLDPPLNPDDAAWAVSRIGGETPAQER